MNREERRKQKSVRKEAVYTLKESDLERIREEARMQGRLEAELKDRTLDFAVDKDIEEAMRIGAEKGFVLTIGIPIKVMHDKYGWRRRKRLPDFAEAIIDEYTAFSEGQKTIQEYIDYVFEHCGLKLEL